MPCIWAAATGTFSGAEHTALQRLPLQPYDCAEVALHVCPLDSYLEFETNCYRICDRYPDHEATEEEILIYSPDVALLVRHERLPIGARKTLDGAGIRQLKSQLYGLELVRDRFLELRKYAEEYLRGLQLSQHKNAGYHARASLQLKERCNADDIGRALGHACRYHAYDGKAVERILIAKAIPQILESIRNEKAAEELRRALPKIGQRPLQEYVILFISQTSRRAVTKSEHAIRIKQ